MSAGPDIPVLRPDLPAPQDYLADLQAIHAAHQYTNFGPCVQRFENALAQYLGPSDESLAVCTASTGTAALQLLLAALGLPAGSRVLVPSLTFPASAQAVLAAGLQPVLVGVCDEQWRLTPAIADAVLARIDAAAVLPVATFGMAVDAQAWSRWSQARGRPVVVDAAAAFDGQQVAAGCHAAISLHATKSFGIGEGGLMLSTDAELLQRARQLSNFGFARHEAMQVSDPRGGNAKLAEMPAAVGLAQLRRWPDLKARRRALYGQFAAAVAALPGFRTMPDMPAAPSVFVVDVRCGEVAALAEHLQAAGIASRRWYYPPLHRHPGLAALPADAESLATTDPLCERLIGLPFGTFLDEHQLARIVAALAAFAGSR